MMDEDANSMSGSSYGISSIWSRISLTYQFYLDKWTPHTISRWVAAGVFVLIFILRVLLLQGWYIIAYALGIYYLNLLIAFLAPKNDPAMDYDSNDDGLELPTKADEEFRPFIRRLPEFKFWYLIMKSTTVAVTCTFFECLNIPVFWPILVMYFFTLFFITMKRQIKHMIKYKYIPFTFGKPKYTSVNEVDPSVQLATQSTQLAIPAVATV